MKISDKTYDSQGSILNWALWHRLHHEHHGTALDPYDYKRGFFFAHFASKCLDKDTAQERARKHVITGDIEEDTVVFYQDL